MRTNLLVCVILALTSSCTSSHTLHREGSAPKLAPNGSIYVSIPADGHYGESTYLNSGRMTAEAIEGAFRK